MTGRNAEIILGGLADAVRHQDPQHIAGLRGPGFDPVPGGQATVGQTCFVFTFNDVRQAHHPTARLRP
jgi:hypothetical protein